MCVCVCVLGGRGVFCGLVALLELLVEEEEERESIVFSV